MFKYVVKRVIAAIITLWALVTIVFFLVRLMPGDPFTSAKLTKEVAANMRSYYGFDKPLILPGELAAWQFRLLYEVHQ